MKISINSLFIAKFIIIFSYLPPVLFERLNSGIEVYFDIMTLLFTAITMIDFFVQERKANEYEMALLLFLLYTLSINFINSQQNIYEYFTSIGYPIVSGYFISSFLVRHDYNGSIKVFGVYFSILVIVNLVLMISFPSGIIMSNEGAVNIRANWLFGSKNNIVQHIPIMIAFILLAQEFSIKKIWWRLILAIFILETISMGPRGVEFMKGSTTALFVLFVMIMMYIFKNVQPVKTMLYFLRFNMQVIIATFISIFLMVISLSNSSGGIIAGFLGLFGKNLGFSFRDATWTILAKSIAEHPLFGIGLKMDIYAYSYIGGVVLRYGLIGLIFLLFLMLSVDVYTVGVDVDIYKIAMIGVLVGGLMNEITYRELVIILTFCKCGAGWNKGIIPMWLSHHFMKSDCCHHGQNMNNYLSG